MTVSPTAQAALMTKEMASEQPQPEPAAAPSSRVGVGGTNAVRADGLGLGNKQ